ncbi:MAG: 2-amino-4-hydroxy-6-hydroxymethyldihydropteridine diphosphokinase [Prevotellaceae bacterium]|jgi:2-amino-4-hydroxy-6-hydroxymethyldihydropteridine diphosphokinase|nr:2-amino-4-hydroxy-6-hydroxymethyldihydropteridine diphosphokinase [Prevotellaceae bacterium]
MLIIALGTNLGDREKNFEHAISLITKKIGKVVKVSSFYKTAPEGFVSDNEFLNAVILVKTKLSVYQIFKQTQRIEKILGRKKKSKNKIYSDRIIDIDILAYNNLTINTKHLTLPHPEIQKRIFVIEPLLEILPNYFI